MDTAGRLTMPLGETIFTVRAIRRLRPDPIPDGDITDVLEAAIRAPSGENLQPWHFVVVTDEKLKGEFGKLYREAWWAKRRDQGIHGPEDIPSDQRVMLSAMKLADRIGQAPVIVLLCALAKGPHAMASVMLASQNLLLAARSLGIGGTITTLHPQVDERLHRLFDVPDTAQVVHCIPLGYPRGRFGPTKRKPLSTVCSLNRWGSPRPEG